MSDQFEKDLEEALTMARAAHSELMSALPGLRDADLGLSMRGGWTIRRVLQHIDQSYGFYSAIILRARGRAAADAVGPGITEATSLEEACRLLDAHFQAIVAATDAVDEETFYRLMPAPDRNEYSVLSTLDGAAGHDREHTEQIKAIAKVSRAR